MTRTRCASGPLLLLLAVLCPAEVVERIAASVGNSVITEGEVLREVRLTAMLNEEPFDASPARKRSAAERLVEQMLVRKELELAHYPAPHEGDIEPLLKKLDRKRLLEYRLTEQDLRQHFLWQLQLLRFVDFRFRLGVQVSAADIDEYYRKRIVPASPGVTLEQAREAIEKTIASERADRQLDVWIKESRARSRIEFREEALQ